MACKYELRKPVTLFTLHLESVLGHLSVLGNLQRQALNVLNLTHKYLSTQTHSYPSLFRLSGKCISLAISLFYAPTYKKTIWESKFKCME